MKELGRWLAERSVFVQVAPPVLGRREWEIYVEEMPEIGAVRPRERPGKNMTVFGQSFEDAMSRLMHLWDGEMEGKPLQ